MAVRAVRVEDAVGLKLFHDYTCIQPGFKGAVKRRGEIITVSDVDILKKCGHYYVYVYDETWSRPDYLHEIEAVEKFAHIVTGENIGIELNEEGKALLIAEKSGLLLVNGVALKEINSTGIFVLVTRKTGSYVKRGDLVGIVDLVPLDVSVKIFEELEKKIAHYKPVIRVIENRHPRIGVIITGTEIVEGLRKDLAGPVVLKKISEYECTPGRLEYARDDIEEISGKILTLLLEHDAVIVTGGMSVDPTDKTPGAIASIADEVVIYGVPIKPTTMSMVAYKGNKAIIGVSSGVIHYPEENILDVVLPWIASGVKIPREFLISLGEGGLTGSFVEKYLSRKVFKPWKEKSGSSY